MTGKESTGILALIILAALLAVVFIIAGAAPLDNLWGFNHLKYFPDYVILIYALLFLLILIPSSSVRLGAFLIGISKRFIKLPAAARILAIAVFSVAVFYMLRVHVHSLGDGYQRIYQVEQGYLYYHTEPLDFFLHAILYRVLKMFGAGSGELSYSLLSFACGTAFILAIYLIKFPGDYGSQAGSVIKLLIISLGGLQFFFGYVESYTLFYIFALLYLSLGTRFLITTKGLLVSSIMLALAIASHITGAIFIPSFIYLVYYNFRYCKPTSFALRYIPVILILVPALGLIGQEIWLRIYVAEYVPSISGGILPIFSASEYSMFSPSHLFDILNEFLLITPVSFVLIIYAVSSRRRDVNSKPVTSFALAVAVCSFLLLLAIDPKLGLARDWDLFSIPCAAIATSVIFYSFWRSKSIGVNSYGSIILAGLSVLFLSSWILTNASEKRQLVRAEDLLSLSDRSRGYSTELLAYYYKYEAKDSQKAYDLLISIPDEAKSARVYSKIAKTLIDLGRHEDALESAHEGLAIDSNFAELHAIAGATWTRLGKPEKGLPHILKTCYLRPDDYQIYHLLGNAYYKLDSIGKAMLAFKEAIRLNPESALFHVEAGNMYRLMGQYDSAIVYTQKGLRLDPNYAQGYQLLEMIRREMSSKINR